MAATGEPGDGPSAPAASRESRHAQAEDPEALLLLLLLQTSWSSHSASELRVDGVSEAEAGIMTENLPSEDSSVGPGNTAADISVVRFTGSDFSITSKF